MLISCLSCLSRALAVIPSLLANPATTSAFLDRVNQHHHSPYPSLPMKPSNPLPSPGSNHELSAHETHVRASAARSASSLRAKRALGRAKRALGRAKRALGRAKRAPTRAKRALSTREARSSTHEAPTHAQIALRHTCSALLPINTEHSTQRLRAVKR